MMAITDRLLRHGEVFYLRGSSFRLRGKEGLTTIVTPSSTAEIPT
jgi:DNA replication protein DnaC